MSGSQRDINIIAGRNNLQGYSVEFASRIPGYTIVWSTKTLVGWRRAQKDVFVFESAARYYVGAHIVSTASCNSILLAYMSFEIYIRILQQYIKLYLNTTAAIMRTCLQGLPVGTVSHKNMYSLRPHMTFLCFLCPAWLIPRRRRRTC